MFRRFLPFFARSVWFSAGLLVGVYVLSAGPLWWIVVAFLVSGFASGWAAGVFTTSRAVANLYSALRAGGEITLPPDYTSPDAARIYVVRLSDSHEGAGIAPVDTDTDRGPGAA